MLLAALLAVAQEAPHVPAPAVPADEEVEEVVIQARLGRTTMLFDRGSDGKLRNCRIMVSSGSQKRDADACQATPVCYAGTADVVTECVELTIVDRITLPPAGTATKPVRGLDVLDLPKLLQGDGMRSPAAAGPVAGTAPSPETERQRVTLPPLPKSPDSGSTIRFSGGQPDGEQALGGEIRIGGD